MGKLNLRGKLAVVIGILVATAAIIAAIGTDRMSQIEGNVDHLVSYAVGETQLATQLEASILSVQRAESSAVLAETDTDAKRYVGEAATHVAETDKLYQELVRLYKHNTRATQAELTAVSAFAKSWENLKQMDKELCDLAVQKTNTKAHSLSNGAGLQQTNEITATLTALIDKSTDDADKAYEANKDDLGSSHTEVARLAEETIVNTLLLHRMQSSHISADDNTERAKVGEQIRVMDGKIAETLAQLARQGQPDERALVAKAADAYKKFQKTTADVLRLSNLATNTNSVDLITGRQRALANELDKILGGIVGGVLQANERDRKASVETYQTARTMMLAVSGAGIALALILAWTIILGITRALTRTIRQLNQTSHQVSLSSGQVSQASQSMAAGASQQASSLEEISASLEEMSSMIGQNAEHAGEANAKANAARDEAMSGRAAMNRMGEAIGAIKASADQTARIVKTIDEIAFQTNLLALNAAVEAARAGDAGKGFAVVAEEVRNLAHRSAEAARNTAALIEESRKNADQGVAVTGEVERTLNQIAAGIQEVSDLVGGVARATGEQAQGIEQINNAVSQLDHVTQANAANAEQSASSSEALQAQAREMTDVVEVLSGIVGAQEHQAAQATKARPAAKEPVAVKEHAAAGPGPKSSARAKSVVPAKKGRQAAARPVAEPVGAASGAESDLARKLGYKANGTGRRGHVSPESVIPLDDDEITGF